MFLGNLKFILLISFEMFYGQIEPVDSISELRFAIGPTAIEIYSEEPLIDKYQLQSIIRY